MTTVGDKPVKRLTHPLLPDRFQQPDLFICDIFDAAPKSDMAGMEHPVFSISKKPDHQTRRYENGDNYIEISPSAKGLATVFDRDILIFCISQLIAALNAGREVSKTVSFKVSDYIVATGKPAGGSAYGRAEDALERLRGTSIKTNIHTGEERQWQVFGLVESAKTIRRDNDGVPLLTVNSTTTFRITTRPSRATLSCFAARVLCRCLSLKCMRGRLIPKPTTMPVQPPPAGMYG